MIPVAEALAEARAAGLDRLDAQLLLAHVLGQTRTWLLAHDDALLADHAADRFRRDAARRARGEPLAYLLGEKEFYGLPLQVDARVLVPRPDTEVLVDWAIERLRDRPDAAPAHVLDLGTGSGAIAIAVKNAQPTAEVTATDASPAALDVARSNAERLRLDIAFAHGSWWQAVAGQRFDLALSNPPYIAGGDPHLVALRHEPLAALTPGGDGLDCLRSLVAGAAPCLRTAAWLLLEHGHDQAEAVRRLLGDAGFTDVQTRRDIAGRPRCTGGMKR